MKIILITGGYGFVGTNLADYLKDKYILWALGRTEQSENKNLYEKFYSWNEFYSIPFEEIDTVIHLAGKAHDTSGKSASQLYFDINTGLTQKVFDQFMLSTAKRFIFFSSVKAAADVVPDCALTEDVTPSPVGAYGESKIAAETYIQSIEWKDKKVYIYRPCMIHGKGNKGNLNLLYSFVKTRIPYPLGKFNNKRSFISIDNLCYITELLLASNIDCGIYNISDDETLSTNKLIHLIGSTLGRKTYIWNIPRRLIFYFAKIGNVMHLPLNTFRLEKLTENYVVSNDKIKTALKIKSLPMTASQGIVKTINSFKSN